MVRFGNDDEGMLLAFNVESGEPIWRLGDDGACYSSPITARIKGTDQLIEWNHNALIGVDMTSGQMHWRFPLPHIGSNQNMPTPTFYNGAILVGGENRGIRQVLPTLEGSTWRVEEGWHQKTSRTGHEHSHRAWKPPVRFFSLWPWSTFLYGHHFG